MPAATPSIRIDDVVVDEAHNAVFRVYLSTPNFGQSVTVNYATVGGGATVGDDYTSAFGSLTFAPGVTEMFVTVPILDDDVSESTEKFNVTLSGASNATISGAGVATGHITDNDTPPRPSVSDATVTEGGLMVHIVTLSAAASTPVVYTFDLKGDTARAGDDFSTTATFSDGVTLSDGHITIPAGVTSFRVSYATTDDTEVEGSETTVLSICKMSGTGTIVDNESTSTTTISSVGDASVTEGGSLIHTVNLSGPSATATTYVFGLTGGTAEASSAMQNPDGSSTVFDNDFRMDATFSNGVTLNNGMLTVPAGLTQFTVSYATFQDNLVEQNETTKLKIDGKTGTGTIVDDDATPTLSVGDVKVIENAGVAVFTVTLSAATGQAVTVSYATGDATAKSGSDYSAIIGTLTFAPNQTIAYVTVPVLDDKVAESPETFNVTLSKPANATILDAVGVGTIIDNDAPAIKSITNAQVEEGGTLVHTVTLSSASKAVSVYAYGLAGGSATAGEDFSITPTFTAGVTLKDGYVTVPAGVSQFNVSVKTLNDINYEQDETTWLTIGEKTGKGTITDDKEYNPIISINNVTVSESAEVAVFTVSLSGTSFKNIYANYGTSNGTAGVNDYSSVSGVLHFAPGELTKTITIPIKNDAVQELEETFNVTLSGVINARPLGDAFGRITKVCTIIDDDRLAIASIGDATAVEGLGLVHTVTLSGITTVKSTYAFSLTGESATAGTDFNVTPTFSNKVTLSGGLLTVPAGVTSFNVLIATKDDKIHEADETLQLSIGGVSAKGTILDNDAVPTVASVNSVTAAEGGALVHTVTLSAASGLVSAYSFDLHGVSATAGNDFAATPTFSDGVTWSGGMVTVPAGVSSFKVNVATLGDHEIESTETTSLTVGGVTGIGNILDVSPTVTAVTSASAIEGSQLIHTVSLSRASSVETSYAFDLAGKAATTGYGMATAGSDFSVTPHFDNGVTLSGGLVTVPAGVSSFKVHIPTVGDSIAEKDEQLSLTVGNKTGVGTIIDNDTIPSVSIYGTTVYEPRTITNGVVDTTTATFTVELSRAYSKAVTVSYNTANGNSHNSIENAVGGPIANRLNDYVSTHGTVTIPAGQTKAYIDVTVCNDGVRHGDQSFRVLLSNPSNATIRGNEADCTIIDTTPVAPGVAVSPLVLDLNGDGVHSVSKAAGVNYDLLNDGAAKQVGWASAQDGLLARDINGDGQINNGSELFGQGTSDGHGGKTKDGFIALAQMDSNQDGVINSLDLGWKDLQVWRDANLNGVTDDGELLSLQSLGVQSLNLAHTSSDKVENGNLHGLIGDYTTTDGKTHEMTDVFFATGDRAATEAVALHGQAATATGLTFDPTASVWHVGTEDGNVLIKGFDATHDVLDLRDLLPGAQGDNLDGLLSIKKEGSSTVIDVKDAAGVDHSIVFAGVDLLGGSTDQQVIHDLLSNHRVVVD